MISGSRMIAANGNHGAILRSLREYIEIFEGGTVATGGIPFIGGLVPSNAADASNDITIQPGTCRLRDADGNTCIAKLDSALTKQIDAAWAKGTNAGGMDTGSAADVTNHLYLIGNRETREVDATFSISASAPTMASGWRFYRRIHSFRRASSTNQAFSAVEIPGGGLQVLLKTPAFDFSKSWSGGADDTAQTGTLALVPTGVQFEALLEAAFFDTTASAASALLITAIDQTDTAANATATAYCAKLTTPNAGGIQQRASGGVSVRTSTSATIRYRAIGSTVDHVFSMATQGWIDWRVA